MTESLRLTPDTNAGLMLTKRIKNPGAPFTTKESVERWNAAAAALPTEAYQKAYERWKERLESLPGTVILATFRAEGRKVVGIGAPNVLQNSLTMNRVWGMPLIPGSALKGLASHYAASMPDDELSQKQREALFGTTEDAGYLIWLDAWHVPDLARSPFAPDVVTPHHGKYYQDPANNPPWDFDDPIPSYFLSARGTFLVAIQAPDDERARTAMTLLRRALAEWGIGAKISTGYGRMELVEYVSA